MESRSSNIRINFDVNGASVQRTKDAINSIQASAEKLSKTLEKTLDKISKTMDAKDKRPGIDAKKSFSVMEKLLGTFDYKATERGIASTSASIQKFVDRTIRDINRLKAAQDEVLSTKPDNIIGGTGWSYNMSQRINLPENHPQGTNSSEDYIKWAKENTPWRKFKNQMGQGGGFWGPGGFGGYMEGRGEALGQWMHLPPGGQAILGKIARYAPTAVGIPLAIGYGYNYAAEAFEKTRGGRAGYTQDLPFSQLNAASAVAGVHNRVFNAIQGKDIAYLAAYRTTLQDERVRASLRNTTLSKERLMLDSGTSPISLTGLVKRGGDILENWAGRSTEWMMEKISGLQLSEADKSTAKELLYKRAALSLTGQQAEQFNSAVQAHQQLQGGFFNTMANRINADAYSRVNAMRMSGRSTRPGKNGVLPYEAFRSELLPGGWDISDYGQGYQSLLGVGKGYGKIISPTWGIVGGHMAGLTNIEQTLALGGMIGGSVGHAGALKNIIQRSTGQGGLDVAVSNKLFMDTLGSINQTGQWGPGNAANVYSGMAAALVSGDGAFDVAGQQRRAATLSMGNAAFGALTGGSQAPLYSATSLLGGIQAMGGRYSLGAEALSKMDPRQLMSIANGGEIANYYKGLGITPDAAKNFLNFQRRSPFFEVSDRMLAGTEAGDLLAQVRADEGKGGSFIDTISRMTEGVSGKGAKARAAEALTQQMAGIIAPFLGKTPQEAEGILMTQLSQVGDWGKMLSAKGVGVSAPGGLEKEALTAQGKTAELESKLGSLNDVAKNTSEIADLIRAQNEFLGVSDRGARAAKGVRNYEGDNTYGSVSASLPGAEPPVVATPKR